jgi:hypothetical protein
MSCSRHNDRADLLPIPSTGSEPRFRAGFFVGVQPLGCQRTLKRGLQQFSNVVRQLEAGSGATRKLRSPAAPPATRSPHDSAGRSSQARRA